MCPGRIKQNILSSVLQLSFAIVFSSFHYTFYSMFFYKNISQTVRLTNEPVEGLTVSYTPVQCRNSEGDAVCGDVAIEEEVEFNVTMIAESCPSNSTKWRQSKMCVFFF